MDSEIDSLQKNGTYEICTLPTGRKPIYCKWVFKVKENSDGTIDRYKARLVAKGFSQKPGIDFTETFAPVAKYNSIRTILSLAAQMDFEIHQMDVTTAFLNGELMEEIFVQPPEGAPCPTHSVWKLKKALYGLKQAPRAWNQRLHDTLSGTDFKFSRGTADHSIYIRKRGEKMFFIVVYVDDLLLVTNSVSELNETREHLKSKFDMKDLGEAKYILGIEILRNRPRRSLTLNQSKYIQDMLKKFGMDESKPIGTPMEKDAKLTKMMSPTTEAERRKMVETPYRNAVGSLMYCMVGTRPDISVAVGVVSQYLTDPGFQHWKAVKRIFRYLKGTIDVGLELGMGNQELLLTGFCDSDWGGNLDDRKSTTGYCFNIGGGTVCWNSKKQPTVALSSTEAEYMAASHAAREALWLKKLLDELGIKKQDSISIFSDSQGAIALGKNPVNHSRTKHIDIQHHFIRDLIESNVIAMKYLQTEEMPADLLTKPLSKEKHEFCMKKLGLFSICRSEWEC
eukprot:GILJ01002727.1.p2 GENE.GILJ01002727.1~~GILJ01002727.1.p2  ORF type:complete len:509 (+),score=47.37 GILJ01002727.1:627-2153(+)